MREGYPDYREIMNERQRRQKQELEGGRQRVLRDMAQGMIDRLGPELSMKNSYQLISVDPDPRKWTITIYFSEGVSHTENFWDFPSDELRAMNMMMRNN